MAEIEHKYSMTMSLNVLKHLGLNLYSNIAAVISEVVANAYDADAKEVNIDFEEGKITITDNGHGMSLEDINKKFLCVGYSKRENNEEKSLVLKRPVMGRKGIGKLSLFSIARNVEIHTHRTLKDGQIESHGLRLNITDIESEIKQNNEYHPKDISVESLPYTNGTKIILTDFKKTNIAHSGAYIRKRIARRFSVLGDAYDFNVKIDGEPITIEDRDFFKKIMFLWLIGDQDDSLQTKFEFERVIKLNGKIDGTPYEIRGWLGTVEKPSDLEQDSTKNNNISIICRGKMAQEDILHSFNEGGMYASYLIGEIHADFLDSDDKEDIATSSRQSINEDDDRYRVLLGHVYSLLKEIQKTWTGLRNEVAKRDAVSKAELVNPALKIWFDNLATDSRKEHATKLFATIDTLHFDKHDEKEKKRELYIQGILAFEKLKLRDSLNELDRLQTVDDLKLASILTDLTDIEANQYYDIAKGRVEVIRQFNKHLEANDKEKLLQKYLFDNLWILNPSWERPTSGTERMESTVQAEFDGVFASLTDEERNGRLDIKYRTSAGSHIIIELKRYTPTYKITGGGLYDQITKYQNALRKCLHESGEVNPNIQSFIILGDTFDEQEFLSHQRILDGANTKILRYNYLIDEALRSYGDYLDRQKEISKIRQIVDSI